MKDYFENLLFVNYMIENYTKLFYTNIFLTFTMNKKWITFCMFLHA